MFSSSGIDVLLRWLAVDGPDPAAGTMLLANNCCGKSRFGAQLLVGDRPASLGAPHQQIFVEASSRLASGRAIEARACAIPSRNPLERCGIEGGARLSYLGTSSVPR